MPVAACGGGGARRAGGGAARIAGVGQEHADRRALDPRLPAPVGRIRGRETRRHGAAADTACGRAQECVDRDHPRVRARRRAGSRVPEDAQGNGGPSRAVRGERSGARHAGVAGARRVPDVYARRVGRAGGVSEGAGVHQALGELVQLRAARPGGLRRRRGAHFALRLLPAPVRRPGRRDRRDLGAASPPDRPLGDPS